MYIQPLFPIKLEPNVAWNENQYDATNENGNEKP